MKKAFLFDMDGVLIDTERLWPKYNETMVRTEVFGEEMFAQVHHFFAAGHNVHSVYEEAVKLGFSVSEEEFYGRYQKVVEALYGEALLMPGLSEFVSHLRTCDFTLGIVSSSPRAWIDLFLARVPALRDQFSVVVSVNHHPTLLPKPAPDGYLEACRLLGIAPHDAVALEDSNAGILAAKHAELLTIGYRGFLREGYQQEEADMYVDGVEELYTWVEYFRGM